MRLLLLTIYCICISCTSGIKYSHKEYDKHEKENELGFDLMSVGYNVISYYEEFDKWPTSETLLLDYIEKNDTTIDISSIVMDSCYATNGDIFHIVYNEHGLIVKVQFQQINRNGYSISINGGQYGEVKIEIFRNIEYPIIENLNDSLESMLKPRIEVIPYVK